MDAVEDYEGLKELDTCEFAADLLDAFEDPVGLGLGGFFDSFDVLSEKALVHADPFG